MVFTRLFNFYRLNHDENLSNKNYNTSLIKDRKNIYTNVHNENTPNWNHRCQYKMNIPINERYILNY